MADQTETDETLIAYLRGRLDETEAARVAAAAAAAPEMAADLALMRGVVGALDAEAAEAAPGALGWARLSRTLDAEPVAAAPASAEVKAPRRPIWQLAAVAAAAVVVWQVAAVPLMRPSSEGYAPVSEAADGTMLAVAFMPTATEAEIRTLIQRVGAQVTAGPSAIGLWTLAFRDAAGRDAGLAKLKATSIVESAQPR